MALIANLDTAPTGRNHRRSLASFLRPANADTYATGDVVGTAVAAALEFPSCSHYFNGGGVITDALLAIGDNCHADADFELLVFNAEPTGIVDNAALLLLAADLPKLVATFIFGVQIITGSSHVVYQSAVDAEKPFSTGAASRSLYGLLINRTTVWTAPLTGCPIVVSLGLRLD